jgi:DOMON domain
VSQIAQKAGSMPLFFSTLLALLALLAYAADPASSSGATLSRVYDHHQVVTHKSAAAGGGPGEVILHWSIELRRPVGDEAGETDGSQGEGGASYSPGENYALSWHLALAVEAETNGWVGVGLGEPTSGGMPGSDIWIFSVENGKPRVSDRYALNQSMPVEDKCNDWTVVSGYEKPSSRTTLVEAIRPLKTGDPQDRDIPRSGLVKLVLAVSPDGMDALSYHGQQGRKSTEFTFNPENSQQQLVDQLRKMESWKEIDLSMNSAPIRPKTTTYQEQTFDLFQLIPEIQDGTQAVHGVYFKPHIDPATSEYGERSIIWGKKHPFSSVCARLLLAHPLSFHIFFFFVLPLLFLSTFSPPLPPPEMESNRGTINQSNRGGKKKKKTLQTSAPLHPGGVPREQLVRAEPPAHAAGRDLAGRTRRVHRDDLRVGARCQREDAAECGRLPVWGQN